MGHVSRGRTPAAAGGEGEDDEVRRYSDGFKSRMIQRMAGPERISALALSKEVGVCHTTLSKWRRDARSLNGTGGVGMGKKKRASKSPRQWTAEEKLQVVVEAASVSDEELGAFLRERGIHEAQLDEWRRAVFGVLNSGTPKKSKRSLESRQIKDLQKELRRKDKALAEVTALLALQKKLEALWGDEEDGTGTRNAR